MLNDSGVIGFAPGTELQLVRRTGDTLIVRAKGVEIEVKESDTTDDATGILAAAQQQAGAQAQAQQAEAVRRQAASDRMADSASAAQAARKQKVAAQINPQIQALDARKPLFSSSFIPEGRIPKRRRRGRPVSRKSSASGRRCRSSTSSGRRF